MMKATKLFVVLLSAGLTVGCASKSDFNALQSKVDGLETRLSTVESTANDARDAAQSAEAKAASAAADARAARAAAEDTNAKLDRGFRKGVMK